MAVISNTIYDQDDRFHDDYMAERHRILERTGRFEFNDDDLKKACEVLSSEGRQATSPATDFSPPDPREKAKRNYIHKEALNIIEEDLKYSHLIADYIDQESLHDETFPERLRANFLKIYDECVTAVPGEMGDGVFLEIVRRLCKRTSSRWNKTAIEILLVHYFALCEVFPKDGPGTDETTEGKP